MKSKTSLIHKTVLKKNIIRYAPIWGIYTIFLLLCLLLMADNATPHVAAAAVESLLAMAWVNLLYAGICTAFLFMDLFNSRLCNALHAFPLRRESWLATHILSGLLFSFVPNLLVTLIAVPILWEYAYIAPIWLAVVTLQYLFFFGTAVLAAMCAGNQLGTIAIYGIIHFIALLVSGMIKLFYEPLLYGVELNIEILLLFFPVAVMGTMEPVDYDITHQVNQSQFVYKGLEGTCWVFLGIFAIIGIACLILARRLYRRRQLETAGDFLSLRRLAPVFLVIFAIGAGAILYLFADAFGGASYVFLAAGLAIGYFAGRMLLGRTVKVFNKKSLLGFGVLAAALASSFFLTWLDPLGISRYVPNIDKVEQAAVIGADHNYLYYNGVIDKEYNDFAYTDKAELEALQDFHRQLIRYRPAWNDGLKCKVKIHYTLKSGRTVTRYYEVGRDTDLGDRAGEYFNDIRYIFNVNDPAVLYQAFEEITVYNYDGKNNTEIELTNQEEIAGLLDAIKADCEAGVMAQNYAYHNGATSSERYSLRFNADDAVFETLNWTVDRRNLDIYPDSVNTLTYLNEMIALHAEE